MTIHDQILAALEFLIANGFGANVSVGLVDVDVFGITGGAGGVAGTGGKSLADVESDLATIKVEANGVDSQTGRQRLGVDTVQTATIPATTQKVVLTAEGGDIRFDLGTTATTTVGALLPKGGMIVLRVSAASALSICGTAAGAFANLGYFKRA